MNKTTKLLGGLLIAAIATSCGGQEITAEMRKKLTDLQTSIDENDNNYVMIARLKQ